MGLDVTRDLTARADEAAAITRADWLTADELMHALHLAYPDAVQQRDYWTTIVVERGSATPLTCAYIMRWELPDPEPTLAELLVQVAPYVPAARTHLACLDARWERDKRLEASDVAVTRAMEDDDSGKVAALKVYRKALRDVTKQEGFPHVIDWPVTPE